MARRFHDPSEVPFQGGGYAGFARVDDLRYDIRRTLRERGKMDCGACGQDVFLYKRALNRGMAWTAWRLYKAGAAHRYIHVKELRGDNHEISQLAFWGLVVAELERRPDGGKKGMYMLTASGVDFALGKLWVQSHALLFNAHCFGMSGDVIRIDDTLPFNFRDLMDNGE